MIKVNIVSGGVWQKGWHCTLRVAAQPLASRLWRFWKVNIGSGNGLMPSGIKPLSKPMLTEIYVAIWHCLTTVNNSDIRIIQQPVTCVRLSYCRLWATSRANPKSAILHTYSSSTNTLRADRSRCSSCKCKCMECNLKLSVNKTDVERWQTLGHPRSINPNMINHVPQQLPIIF